MKNDFTVIAVIMDRSGSMQNVCQATINGFNEFLAGQKALPGECKLHLVQFDHEYKVVYDMVPISEVPPLDATTYRPRGNTALLDAVGRTVNDLGERLAKMEESERPSKVVVVIQTDGEENASTEFKTRKTIFDMITHQQSKYAWEFIFLGANQDAICVGGALGVPMLSSMSYTSSASNVKSVYGSMNNAIGHMRSVGGLASFTYQDRMAAVAPAVPDVIDNTVKVDDTSSKSN